MNTLTKTLLASGATASLLAFGIQSAQAVPTFTTSGCASTTECTMGELFNGGSFTIFDTATPSASVTVGNFVVNGNDFGLGTTGSDTAATVLLGASPLADFTLEYSFIEFANAGTTDLSFNFSYDVTGTGYSFVASLFGLTDISINDPATEDIQGVKGLNSGGSNVATYGVDENTPANQASFAPVTSLSVSDGFVLSGVDVGDPAIAINTFTQSFVLEPTEPPFSTPEPGTILGLLAVGSLGALSRKRKA